jgi:hypothetical protein
LAARQIRSKLSKTIEGITMVVELDVFSGRPNPRWELDEKSAATVTRLQSSLHLARRAPPDPPALGYRGFKCDGPAGSVLVYSGYVHTQTGILADPLFGVERFLLGTLPKEFAALAKVITAELRPE